MLRFNAPSMKVKVSLAVLILKSLQINPFPMMSHKVDSREQRNGLSKLSITSGAGMIAQQLGTRTSLAKDLSSVPSTTLGCSKWSMTPAPKGLMPSFGLSEQLHSNTHAFPTDTQAYKTKNLFKKREMNTSAYLTTVKRCKQVSVLHLN